MKRVTKLLCALTLALPAGFAFADKVVEKPVVADTPQAFAEVASEVREDLKEGGRYEFITASDRAKVEVDLDQMEQMLQKSGSVAAMSDPDRVKLFNLQENLNGLLTHSDRNRLICEHRAPVGTNIQTTTCNTVGEIELARRRGQKNMQDLQLNGSLKCANGFCKGN